MGSVVDRGEGSGEVPEDAETGQVVEQSEEAFLVDCELALAISNAEKAAYETELAKWTAESARIQFEQDKLNHEHQLDGHYSFDKQVTQKSVNKLLRAIHVWHMHDPGLPWTINLNSVGGSVYAGNALIDELIAHSLRGGGTHEITIKVRGVAASMASMILQAADVRVIGPNSQLMLHKGGTGLHGMIDVDSLSDELQWQLNSTDWMIKLFLSRTDKLTRPEMLTKMDRRDWWMSSDEAIKLGLADVIG